MNRLQGKVALIVGGTSGMGAAIARRFHAEGAAVVVTGSSIASVDASLTALPEVEAIASNVADVTAIRALVEHVSDRYGRIDVLFINAGVARLVPSEAVDEACFDDTFNVNVRGPYFLLAAAIPLIPDGGSIILTSSTSALRGVPGLSVYSASKAALRSLGLTFAAELAPRRIRVNTITPGPIDTPIITKMGLSPEQMAGFAQAMIAKVPIGRQGEPDEIAAAAVYFASDESKFTTGAELRIDGGMTLA